ncbi:MAG: DNA polymerase III subunit alpha [Rothia sp.]|uniref:DNA polymerase III subunit alpha n=1 Tax=Rothia sp. (in: high G+C Gram-positive bacteria) TaxID=1885016 RepID=UPI001CB56CD4|nr:DNA polymerase III subunit alpha [Rothia sp. (in: high G+C Gram-positive bacteria)]MBF1680615.1 DNA polymerase III subunit alpha [Rothia sp. (in: high G+C Gram-positive bacteria)]
MATKEFTHLHVHTEYSMLDGAARLGDLFTHAKELGMKSMATSDHGFLFGAFDFWRQAKAHDIKPIIGVEAYLTPGTHRTDRSRVRWGDGSRDDVSGGGAYTHMTMWAETTEGMHNLFRASSIASLEGQLYKPRMDREVLQTYSKGLIATTGCPSGEVQTRLRLGQFDEAVQAASEFRDIFGKDNFYCEVMDHGLDIERNVQEDLHRLAKKLNLPFVATNDLHYTRQEDHTAHAALLCVQSGSTLTDPKRFKFDADNFYLRSAEEMYALFGDIPGACENTLEIAERCNVEFNTKANYMPNFPVPEGENEESWFVKEVEKGLHYRFPDGVPDKVRKQAEYEVGVITSMGFPGYFLVVADFINWAKRNGIRVGPGRGSGAGSMVAYAMRITDLNPLDHDLIFERFLNPDRVSMPDFDVDFDDRRRGEVIDYVTEKYGEEKVAQIVTFGTIKAKQALKDASRVMDQPYSVGERLTKAMPPDVMGKNIALANVYNEEDKRYAEAADLRALIEDPVDKIYGQVFETAKGLEGLKRQWGVHAAGVIMSSKDLVDVIPVMRREADGQVITQFDYPTCEGLGLIKMDFLGLRNLTIISDAVENIKSNRGIDLDLESLSLDDPESYRLLARGDTLGVFQLDGGPMRSLLKLMEPEEFEHISAVLALYRPGPMGANSHTNYALRKNGKQEIEPIHPELEEPLKDILDTTYGLIVYQEQVMAIAQKVANYTLGEADLLRRAMGKKKKAELDKQYATFHDGMISNGYSEGAVKALWDILLPFSDYAFNKAHTAAYGLVSYWTAYLKAHFPQEYMAALLTSVGDNKDKLALYLNECRAMGITVLAPDVNESTLTFAPVGEDIRFGMGAIRNVGANVVEGMIAAREEKGRYESFNDFLKKVPLQVCNKRTIESLIKAGAFDDLGHTRRSLSLIHEAAVDAAVAVKRKEAAGQFDLFGSLGMDDALGDELTVTIPDVPDWDRREKLNFERDMLGLYVSDHPLRGLERALSDAATHSVHDIIGEDSHVRDGETVTIAGMLTGVSRRIAKSSGNQYASVELEDPSGATITVMFFSRAYETMGAALADDLICSIRGRVQRRDDGSVNMSAQELQILEISDDGRAAPITIVVPEYLVTEANLKELKETLRDHKGTADVRMLIRTRDKEQLVLLDPSVRVEPNPSLFGEIKTIFGPSCIRR